jgi:hypothetical protein
MYMAARATGVALLLAVALLVPALSHAQSAQQDSLRAAIRAAITTDPRSAGMSQAQLDSIVNALSAQAAKRGVTAGDITWRPYSADSVTSVPPQTPSCWGFPGVFCTLNAAYGFSSNDLWMPLVLFAAAAAFFVIVALMRHHGHPHAQFESSLLA